MHPSPTEAPSTLPAFVLALALLGALSAGGGQAYFTWGNGDLGTTVTPRYLAPGFDPGLAQTTPLVFVVPTAKTIHKLNVLQPIAGVGGDVVYTLYVNGVASVLTATLLASAASGSDLVNNVAAPAGATLALVVTKAGAITTSPGNVEVSVEVF